MSKTALDIGGGSTLVENVDSDGDPEETSEPSTPDSPHSSHGGSQILSKTSSTSSLKARAMERQAKRLPKTPGNRDEINQDLQDELIKVLEQGHEMANFGQLALTNEQVPMHIMHASHLVELVLAENDISVLRDDFFHELVNLRKVDLSNNQLQVVPESLFKIPKLEHVLLDHNQISALPTSETPGTPPLSLPALKILGLSWNNLDVFPFHLVMVAPRLEHIYVNENARLLSLPSPAEFRMVPRYGQVIAISIDNRPVLMNITRNPEYEAVRVKFEVNKIYPDAVNNLPFLYLGSVRTAQCREVYQDLNVEYVLTCGRKLDPVIEEGMHWKELPLDDAPTEDIAPFFVDAIQFIDEALSSNKGILVHCFAGLSRSVAVTIAYLMTRQGLSRDEALARIRETRPNAHPNTGFMATLKQYEHELARTRGH